MHVWLQHSMSCSLAALHLPLLTTGVRRMLTGCMASARTSSWLTLSACSWPTPRRILTRPLRFCLLRAMAPRKASPSNCHRHPAGPRRPLFVSRQLLGMTLLAELVPETNALMM